MSLCDDSLRKGPWSFEEDEILRASVALLGEKRWDAIARATGLKRGGKSCRLRWLNYLRPSLKHSPISVEEEQIIVRLHQRWGNKWARIARRLPGRTDNEIKNYWRGCLRKKSTPQLIDQTEGCTGKPNTQEITSMSPYSSDDEADYNDVVREISLDKGKNNNCEEPSSSSGTTTDECGSAGDVPDVLMSPDSPYESHFTNWVSLLKSENEVMVGGHCNGVSVGCCNWSWEEGNNSTTSLGCWDKLWDMDLFISDN